MIFPCPQRTSYPLPEIASRHGEGPRNEGEAMKMGNELKAKFDGKVKTIKVKEHQAVDKD